jgi:multicomponent Na+:H+ antiporter subunit D
MGQEMLVIAGLMLCVGVLIDRSGTADVREMGGLWREMPWLATVFFVLGMALAGIPPLAGFYGKALVLRAGVEAGAWWLVGATLVTAVLTLAAVLRVWCMVFWSPTRAPALLVRDGGEIGKFRPVGSAYLALWLLVGVSVAYGLAAEPMLTFARAATSELTEPRSYVDAVLSAGVEAELGEGDAPGSMASANVGAGVVVRVPAEGVR